MFEWLIVLPLQFANPRSKKMIFTKLLPNKEIDDAGNHQ